LGQDEEDTASVLHPRLQGEYLRLILDTLISFVLPQGGDDTFANFPSHLKAVLQHALPKVTVLATTYPKYETRGDLHECVGRFKEW
jgi:hypothetical protein